jgi:hypothetical protein
MGNWFGTKMTKEQEMHAMTPYWGRDAANDIDQKLIDLCAGLCAMLGMDATNPEDRDFLHLLLSKTEESIDFATLITTRIHLWKQCAVCIALGDLETVETMRELRTNSLHMFRQMFSLSTQKEIR